jgi:hypothetical protein
MVKEPRPGRTRDLSISVPVAVALIRQTLACSSATYTHPAQSANRSKPRYKAQPMAAGPDLKKGHQVPDNTTLTPRQFTHSIGVQDLQNSINPLPRMIHTRALVLPANRTRRLIFVCKFTININQQSNNQSTLPWYN